MSKRGKIFLGLVAAVLLGVIAWTVLSIPTPTPPEAVDASEQKLMRYGKNTIAEEKNGVKIWDLTSESSVMNVDTQDTDFTNIIGHFYEKDGTVVEITAPHGFYNGKVKDIKLDGGVQVTTTKNAKLTSDALTWDNTKEILAALGNAKGTQPGMEINGDKIESWDGFQSFKATGHAKVVRGKAK